MHKTTKMPNPPTPTAPHPIPMTCNKNEVLGQIPEHSEEKDGKNRMSRKNKERQFITKRSHDGNIYAESTLSLNAIGGDQLIQYVNLLWWIRRLIV